MVLLTAPGVRGGGAVLARWCGIPRKCQDSPWVSCTEAAESAGVTYLLENVDERAMQSAY